MYITLKECDVLASFEIWEVELDENSYIKFKHPLMLHPFRLPVEPDCEDGEMLISVKYPALAISARGNSREELFECINGDIRFAWETYVCEDDVNLRNLAKTIKDNYLRFSENKRCRCLIP